MIRSYKIEQKLLKYTALVKSVMVCFIILSLCACSFDNPWDDIEDNIFVSDVAYLAISLTSDGEPLLINTGDEDDVANAHFYFYDSEGNYVTRGEIEFSDNVVSGKYLIILKGLTDTSYLNYVVTVLNQPDGFTPSDNLADMDSIMTKIANSPIYDSSNNLVMSNSTYYDSNRKYNFATVIKSTDFLEGTIPDLSTLSPTLTIPVEPLAAKITVTTDELTNTKFTWSEDNGSDETHTLYQIGEQNKYVELLGWKINAIARQSYIFKNIDATVWNNTLSWDWNDTDSQRSYWAKSINYNIESDYPVDNSVGKTDDDEANSTSWFNEYLKYVSLKSDLNSIGGDDYCGENTNTAGENGVLSDLNTSLSAITCILLKAKAWTQGDSEGEYVSLESAGTGGLMYYNIPIKHIYKDGDDETLSEGEYGVVRNHHYTVKIESLSDLGTPIIDEEEVIVPSNTDYNLTFNISSLPWKLHDENVDYSKQLDGDYIDITGGNSGDEENSGVDTSASNQWSVTEIDITTSH